MFLPPPLPPRTTPPYPIFVTLLSFPKNDLTLLCDIATRFTNAIAAHTYDAIRHDTNRVQVIQDQFDAIDFSDNEIKKVDNFPRYSRLSSILLCNNHVSRIAPDLGSQLPNLTCIILTNNKVRGGDGSTRDATRCTRVENRSGKNIK